MNRRRSTAVIPLLVAVALISACGGSEPEPAASPSPTSDGQLVIGALLPRTGEARHIRPPQLVGVRLAVADINDAGGVLGQPVRVLEGDIGDRRSGLAVGAAQALVGRDVDAVLIGGSSGVTPTLLPTLVEGDVLAVSPSNTADELGAIADEGLYFRTAPTDRLQGEALGSRVIEDDAPSLRILASDDPYGKALAEAMNRTAQAGGVDVAPPILVPPGAPAAEQVRQVAAANPAAVAVLLSGRGEPLLRQLQEQGLGGGQKRLYLSDALLTSYPQLPAGTLQGAQVARPGAPASEEVRNRLTAGAAAPSETSLALEAYDAVVLIALAATAAQSDQGPAMAAQMRELTRNGAVCRDFAACAGALKDNANIDYEGLSGTIDLDPKGNRTVATFTVHRYAADNTFAPVGPLQRRMS